MSWLLISTLATTTPRAELVLGNAVFVGIDGGLIGLNTTEPTSTLHVGGDVTTDSRLHIGSDHPSGSVGSAINVNLQLGQAFTRADSLARSGLRINTSPDSGSNHLTIGELDTSDQAANGAYYISVSNWAGTANWPICLNPWGGPVGIGTRDPSAQLEVRTREANYGMRISRHGSAGQLASLIFEDGSRALGTGATSRIVSSTGDLRLSTGGSSGSFSGGSERMRITADGKVGIATTDPKSTLHVGGDVTTDSRLHIGSDHPSASVGSAINVNLQLGQAFTRADSLVRSGLRINTSPDSGSNHLTIGELDTSDQAANGAYYISVSNWAGTANWPICLNPWGGNVGIGTRHPSATLDVKGSVKCTSLSQTSDRTLKANIAPTSLGLAFVRQQLWPVQYTWRRAEERRQQAGQQGGRHSEWQEGEEGGERGREQGDEQEDEGSDAMQHGFLAQDIERTALRAAVRGSEGAKSLEYTQILAPAVRAIQQLADQADEHAKLLRDARATIQAQAERLSRLEARLAAIEPH